MSLAQDAGVTDVVRKRKFAQDREDLEFQERSVVFQQKQLDHAFSLKERETRLSFEVGGNDVALKKEELALKKEEFALKKEEFELKEKDSALNEKDLRLSVEIDEKKLALKQKEIAMQQKYKHAHKAKPGHARAAAVAMPTSRAVPNASAPVAPAAILKQTGLYSEDVSGADKSFFYSVPKP